MKTKVQATLALLIVVGFLALCGWQAYHGALDTDMKQSLIISLATAIGYWLGSSKSSAEKTDLMAENPGKNPPPEKTP